jgi:hypothetical protein
MIKQWTEAGAASTANLAVASHGLAIPSPEEELATARRDTAADALEWAATDLDPEPGFIDSPPALALRRMAAEIREGKRAIPASEPADEGGAGDGQ